MESTPDLAAIMAAKSEDELLAVLIQPEDYLPEAPAAALAELRKRNLSTKQTEILRTILERCEAQSQELCPHCLRPAAFEVFTICAHCGQDKNAVRFPCPKCSTTIEAPKISAGSLKPCSGCGTNVPVPPVTAEALLIESDDEMPGVHEGNLQRLRVALVETGLKESEWALTLIDLVHLPPERLVDHLRSRKIETTLARAAARAIRAIGPSLKKETDKAINKNILSGGIFLGLGLLVTLISFSAATRVGGTYWICYGAIIGGAIQLLVGLEQDRRRKRDTTDEAGETYNGPRCVACAAPIQAGLKACPQCGWTQPV